MYVGICDFIVHRIMKSSMQDNESSRQQQQGWKTVWIVF